MLSYNGNSLVLPAQFIQAIRDAGYKSLGSALAELVDNAFEAKADNVSVTFNSTNNSGDSDLNVVVADNGLGMDTQTLGHSLQFGWSSRFNGRNSVGRYGMGLPNASLSHARRVEVWTSTDGKRAHRAHLDVDEIVSGKSEAIPPAISAPYAEFRKLCPFAKGTIVVLKQCDRLKSRKIELLSRKLRSELGCLFRYQLWSGRTITVGGENVFPIDPLFDRKGANLSGAKAFGPELSYEIGIPEGCGKTSLVKVRFTELPVNKWHSMSNEEKNLYGIAKRAGVSVVRAGREIDRGWFFMGQKRRENYDDWWRCEVRFDPDLDELFGVTHTKQEIHPTENLSSILTPDIERVARELNGRVRKAFVVVKASGHIQRESERFAARFDNLIEPPPQATRAIKTSTALRRGGRGRVGGLEYRLQMKKLDELAFFVPTLEGARLTVVLNEQHPFVRHACAAALANGNKCSDAGQRYLELMILAASRAEVLLAIDKKTQSWINEFRKSWSNILATFLS
jgi:Histidine kinase-, DNA gyrase B-, and HSP90-like ATPase